MAGWLSSGQRKEQGVEVMAVKECLYSKVLPRHLRNTNTVTERERPRSCFEPGRRPTKIATKLSAARYTEEDEEKRAEGGGVREEAEEGKREIMMNGSCSNTLSHQKMLIVDIDDGDYCGLRTNSAQSSIGLQKQSSNQHQTFEYWLPFSLRQSTERVPAAAVATAEEETAENGCLKRAASFSIFRHEAAAGALSEGVVPKSRKQGQDQPQLATNTSTPGASTDGSLQKNELTAVDVMSIEEGCRLVFPHSIRKDSSCCTDTKHAGETTTTVSETEIGCGENEPAEEGSDREDVRSCSTKVGGVCEKPADTECNASLNSDTMELLSEENIYLNALPLAVSSNCSSINTSLSSLQDEAQQDDELQLASVLQTCSACHSPSQDLTVLLCFHAVCSQCVLPAEENLVRCGVCKNQQVSPQDGIKSLADMFPALFGPRSTNVSSDVFLDGGRGKMSSERLQPLKKDSPLSLSVKGTSAAGIAPSSGQCEGNEGYENAHCTFQSEPELPAKKTDNDVAELFTVDKELEEEQDAEKAKKDVAETGDGESGTVISSGRMPEGVEESSWDVCGACGREENLQHMCLTCGGVSLCPDCLSAHRNLPVTRDHQLLPLRVPFSPLTLLAHHRPLCPRHGHELTLQCHTCAVLLCHRCRTPQHVQHEVQDLGSANHCQKKQLLVLQRSVKQHLLLARSVGRTIRDQRGRLLHTLDLRQLVRTAAQSRVQRVMAEAEELISQIDEKAESQASLLSKVEKNVTHVQSEGQRIGSLLSAVREETPHLTSLVLQNNCCARFDYLRQNTCLRVKEMEEVVFLPAVGREAQCIGYNSLGTLRSVAVNVPDTAMTVLSIIHTPGKVNAVAVTPFNEVVCLSSDTNTCQVWDRRGVMLCDVSRDVNKPHDVAVLPNGILVVLCAADIDNDNGGSSSKHKEDRACLAFLSPSGSPLSRVPISSVLGHTKIHCPRDWTLLVSQEKHNVLTMYAVVVTPTDATTGPSLSVLRRLSCHPGLQNPRHVTLTLTGDWLVSDRGFYLRTVTEEYDVMTVLSEEEPVAALDPPRHRYCQAWTAATRKRMLCGVCCDRQGRLLAADSGKNGLYILTSSTSSPCNGERCFLSLQELNPSAHVTSLALDTDDHLVLGMSDGSVYILKLGSDG